MFLSKVEEVRVVASAERQNVAVWESCDKSAQHLSDGLNSDPSTSVNNWVHLLSSFTEQLHEVVFEITNFLRIGLCLKRILRSPHNDAVLGRDCLLVDHL